MSEFGARSLVFFASASVLVIEILAGRLMAPYVGVTIESFTGIIGTVLAAIALGSWLGGRAADRGRPERLLGPLLIAGGALTLLAPLIVTLFGPALRGTNPVQIVTLAALAFLAPAVVLSAVSPVVVTLRLDDLSQTGSVVGRLSATATAGALFGTFVTGFVLLASFPTRPIMVGVGATLVAVGASMQSRSAPGRKQASAAVLLSVVIGAGSISVSGPCKIETSYSCVIIESDPLREHGRTLWLDTSKHSYVDVVDPTHLEFRYVKVIADVVTSLDLPDAPAVMSIGGGGFTLPRWIRDTYPAAIHTVLELDFRLVELAYAELGLQLGDVDEMRIGDARVSIRSVDGPVDLVLADAFGGFVVPWHLTTREFLTDVAATMAPDGVFVMNLIDYPPASFARAEAATALAVFSHVMVIAPPDYFDGGLGGNYVIVASHTPLEPASVALSLGARGSIEEIREGEALEVWIRGARVLTDNFAPVDQLITR